MKTPRSLAMTSDHHRGWLLLAALAYLSFVVYGSLVPLDFKPRSIAEAWTAFHEIRYLQLGIGSRADWVANVLLFVPLSFLWLGVIWSEANRPLRIAASALVLAGCTALSLAIEFTQIFFPPRTVSLNDIIAEVFGAAIGVAAWWLVGSKVMAWFTGWSRTLAPAGVAERLLYAYLFLLFGYNVLPLDLTISPVELFHKWREGKVLLIPFSAPFPTAAQRAYDLLTDIAIWVPAAFLWRTSAPRTLAGVMARVLGAAVLLEALQLFVYSRVTDLTDIITAAVGGVVGGLLGARAALGQRPEIPRRSGASSWWPTLLWFTGLVGIVGVLVAVFWYPFDFRTDWGFVRGRVAALQRAPLATYYYGTEFRAVTEVLHKLGFFFPLGAWLALGAHSAQRRFRVPGFVLHASAVALIAGLAAGIEAGQIFLPSKYADATDWVLETLGGLAGYFGVGMILRHRRSAGSVEVHDPHQRPRRSPRATSGRRPHPGERTASPTEN